MAERAFVGLAYGVAWTHGRQLTCASDERVI
jgi:hypothetical protein